ncbi:hypothetical protein H0H81_004648 [Sphagnurus paluster]|uniref:Uncharacterized protein n=1 Tax=Sphagnurus paluster TaxID=117069 RepID=A0A9P7GLZ9_9AGAR|nr:hypothetical protein H0H81_004648 [Sphagnurus paluster]
MAVDIPKTFGALLIGAIVASAFSGIVTVQTFAYFKYYPTDRAPLKALAPRYFAHSVREHVFMGPSDRALWRRFED